MTSHEEGRARSRADSVGRRWGLALGLSLARACLPHLLSTTSVGRGDSGETPSRGLPSPQESPAPQRYALLRQLEQWWSCCTGPIYILQPYVPSSKSNGR
jgi:hypothetical protein